MPRTCGQRTAAGRPAAGPPPTEAGGGGSRARGRCGQAGVRHRATFPPRRPERRAAISGTVAAEQLNQKEGDTVGARGRFWWPSTSST
ncbi:hypothetical protein C2845_PM11G20830 [Panicum miliaceum]|uniref:Uncharacterized protein n=1 Tax=Panicum miliaceum TaxID=4540 RepID=A0A3L6RTZ6_PANMI|nr:hypothetical protein C2845_PM11G20830 [Panicum miliaceum]